MNFDKKKYQLRILKLFKKTLKLGKKITFLTFNKLPINLKNNLKNMRENSILKLSIIQLHKFLRGKWVKLLINYNLWF